MNVNDIYTNGEIALAGWIWLKQLGANKTTQLIKSGRLIKVEE